VQLATRGRVETGPESLSRAVASGDGTVFHNAAADEIESAFLVEEVTRAASLVLATDAAASAAAGDSTPTSLLGCGVGVGGARVGATNDTAAAHMQLPPPGPLFSASPSPLPTPSRSEMKAAFREHGYTIARGVVPRSAIAAVVSMINRGLGTPGASDLISLFRALLFFVALLLRSFVRFFLRSLVPSFLPPCVLFCFVCFISFVVCPFLVSAVT
jgi:hypothetical protein